MSCGMDEFRSVEAMRVTIGSTGKTIIFWEHKKHSTSLMNSGRCFSTSSFVPVFPSRAAKNPITCHTSETSQTKNKTI